jgi:hypothetical protein
MGDLCRRVVFALLSASLLVGIGRQADAANVPAPFTPLRVVTVAGGVEVQPWGRTYRFDAGPLPSEIRSRGFAVFTGRPRFVVGLETGERDILWEAPVVASAAGDAVTLRTAGWLPGVTVSATTRIEYDGMIAVDLSLTAGRNLELRRLSYQIDLSSNVTQFYSHHLRYDPAIGNVVKSEMLQSAGPLPARLALDFVPTLALGNRRVGIEWWSETNAHWSPLAGAPSFEVTKGTGATRLQVSPIRAPRTLALNGVWRDQFSLFVFPTRPGPTRWRSTRFGSYTLSPRLDRSVGTRLVYMATQETFHARYDGLPGSIDDSVQRALRAELRSRSVGYMPYGMLMIAPLMHPQIFANYELWAAYKWFKIQPGDLNPVLERNHPSLEVGDPYTYAACAGRMDYFDWMLGDVVHTLRSERPDALYYDQGVITRMCVNSPKLAGTTGRQVWEYRNVRRYYKRLYETVQAEAPNTLLVLHTNGAAKALGAFVDFQMSGEGLNGFFGNGYPPAVYFSTPSVYTPDYYALPPGYLDAQLFPRVGGISSLIPQIKWAIDPQQPERGRAFQRGLHSITLVNDLNAPIWFSDVETSLEIYQAIDRFGDIGAAKVHPWWSNQFRVRRPAGIQATVWTAGGRAMLVFANPGKSTVRGRVELDLPGLGVAAARRYRDLEQPDQPPALLSASGFEVTVRPHDLRILAVE